MQNSKKGASEMRKAYIRPYIEIKDFTAENIVTESGIRTAEQMVRDDMGAGVTTYTTDWQDILNTAE